MVFQFILKLFWGNDIGRLNKFFKIAYGRPKITPPGQCVTNIQIAIRFRHLQKDATRKDKRRQMY